MKKTIKKILISFFSNHRWARKHVGGYWQKWIFSVSVGDMWFNLEKEKIEEFRPGAGMGDPYCEYYPISYFGYRRHFKKNEKKCMRMTKLKKVLKNY